MKIKVLAIALILAFIFSLSAFAAENDYGTPEYVAIDIADYGTITLALYPEVAPETVANFLSLVDDGFYDGLTFHRIIFGFMMQGGDPLGNGTGGSSHKIRGEFSANGFDNKLSHTRGVISMARARDYDSASSQFFIMHMDGTYLDGSYAAFGEVVSGIDVVDSVCITTPVVDNNGTVPTSKQPVITSIRRVAAEDVVLDAAQSGD